MVRINLTLSSLMVMIELLLSLPMGVGTPGAPGVPTPGALLLLSELKAINKDGFDGLYPHKHFLVGDYLWSISTHVFSFDLSIKIHSSMKIYHVNIAYFDQ